MCQNADCLLVLGRLSTRLQDTAGKAQRPKTKEAKLDLLSWTLAWDVFALSLAITGQLCFLDCMMHKKVVTEVAATNSAAIALVYDELVRREWQEKSCKLGKTYLPKMRSKIHLIDDSLVRRARVALNLGNVRAQGHQQTCYIA